MSSTKNVRNTLARQLSQRRTAVPEKHDPATNKHGMSCSLNGDDVNASCATRTVFTNFVTFQQMDRELSLKHTILMTRLFNLNEASVMMIVPLLRKIGELHWRFCGLVHEGKQTLLENVMFGDDDDVRKMFNDDFIRQTMGSLKAHWDDSKQYMEMMGKFLNYREFHSDVGMFSHLPKEEAYRAFGIDWLENWRELVGHKELEECAPYNDHNPPMFIVSNRFPSLEMCPMPKEVVTGDYIHPVCFGEILKEQSSQMVMSQNGVDTPLICPETSAKIDALFTDPKCYDFTCGCGADGTCYRADTPRY